MELVKFYTESFAFYLGENAFLIPTF